MPYDENGVFQPGEVRPLEGRLFDVIPPDDPSEPEPASDADREWYTQLVQTTARLLRYVVRQVHVNYRLCRGVSFNGAQCEGMMRFADQIERLLNSEVGRRVIAKDVNRLAKQVGLVAYSAEPGQRANWPMATQPRLTLEEAAAIITDAFWGRLPTAADAAANTSHMIPIE